MRSYMRRNGSLSDFILAFSLSLFSFIFFAPLEPLLFGSMNDEKIA